MRRTMASAAALVAIVGGGLATAASSASAAPASPAALSCRLTWADANTAGVSCTGSAYFRGYALCVNGAVALGARTRSGGTSYAYCTQEGSRLLQPVEWYGQAA